MANRKKRACTYKRYMSHDQAYMVAKKTWDTSQFRVYKCPYCDGWHFSRHKLARMTYLFQKIEQERAARQ